MAVTAHDASRAQPSRNGLAGLAGPQTAADVAGRFFGADRRLWAARLWRRVSVSYRRSSERSISTSRVATVKPL